MIQPSSESYTFCFVDENRGHQLSFRDTVEVLNQSLPNGADELVLLESLLVGTYWTERTEEIAGLDGVINLENRDNHHWIGPLRAVRSALLQERAAILQEDIMSINDYIACRPGMLHASFYSHAGVEQCGQIQGLQSGECEEVENIVLVNVGKELIQAVDIIRLKLDARALMSEEFHAYEKYIADCET